ncbi:MAG: aminotransferase class III-fold pyridoxal phosphate-dependent enzyme, partial [Armatimonadia bacterium]
MSYDLNWANLDPNTIPNITVPPPGPKSVEWHGRASKYMKGYSSQVRLFPVAFESGHGVTLTDVDGNVYLDFSSGIYVTSLGHCHPKISEATANAAKTLMNCHDFTTPVKAKLLEKLVSILPGDLGGVQLYDSGTTAVEAGLRICRAANHPKLEFISFYKDFHGKTLGAVSLARMDPTQGLRAPGFSLTPRPFCYRCTFDKSPETCQMH